MLFLQVIEAISGRYGPVLGLESLACALSTAAAKRRIIKKEINRYSGPVCAHDSL